METKSKYYVVENWASANPEKNCNSKIRIAEIPNDFPFFLNNKLGHNSIRHLRRHDPIWNEFNSKSRKVADKICEEKFILNCHDFILTPNNEKFNEYSFDLLQHTIHGKYDNEFSGLHLISNLNKEIISIEQTKAEDIHGVWEARITLKNNKRNKIYEKTSTFFPRMWTPTHFMFESYSAISILQINSNQIEYESKTNSGIPVKIIIRNNRAKSIYPLYTERTASS